MEIDNPTLKDLSVFDQEEASSIFNTFNFTKTSGGKAKLKQAFSKSLNSIDEIKGIQRTLTIIQQKKELWPEMISNGSIMIIHKFYETIIDNIPAYPSVVSAYAYKYFHRSDFSLVKYSTGHAFDFIKGMQHLISLFLNDEAPAPLQNVLQRAEKILNKEQFNVIQKKDKYEDLTIIEMLQLANFLRYHYKQNIFELVEIYSQLDAWYGMAMAADKFNLILPEFIVGNVPTIQATGLFHVLLQQPVAYDVELNQDNNFIFLTGANMAGKSTFIKSVGVAVFLAHIGMGVPAKSMQLTLFDGLLSNINVADNIAKGESYFYNEVQRIKNTILKINDGRKWLILIDELFKGTNVEDAMRCSAIVIEGLIKIKNSLFILSTHLYEIGEKLKIHKKISFKYFETMVDDEQLKFSYLLKEGISNDRIGYLILKREKVIDLLEKL